MNSRVELRIDDDIKKRAVDRLKGSGLSLSDYLRASIGTLANEGLPKGIGMPNQDTLDSIFEMVDSINGNKKLDIAHNREELDNLLNG